MVGDPSPSAVQLCRRIIAEHSKSFSLASRLLPARCRDDAIVVYAWCRRADDAIDESGDARRALARLREELIEIADGRSMSDPVLEAFRIVRTRCRIPLAYMEELLSGMEMDSASHDYRTMEDLYRYCYRVAGVVGLMMCHVLGVRSDDALPHAAHLGMAMQLTNICRDVDEDWRRGRCYLPQSMLPSSALEVLASPAMPTLPLEVRQSLKPVVRRLLDRADELYRSGDDGLGYLDGRSAWAIRTARLVYSKIGAVIARRDYDVGRGRAFLSKGRKMQLAMQAMFERRVAAVHPELRRRAPTRPTKTLTWDELMNTEPLRDHLDERGADA